MMSAVSDADAFDTLYAGGVTDGLLVIAQRWTACARRSRPAGEAGAS